MSLMGCLDRQGRLLGQQNCLYAVAFRKTMHVEAAPGRAGLCSGAVDKNKTALVCAACSACSLALSATLSFKFSYRRVQGAQRLHKTRWQALAPLRHACQLMCAADIGECPAQCGRASTGWQ